MGSYVMCGHYLSNVPAGGTVSLSCSPWNLPPARYVIVQFPIVDQMNFCELEVCARGEPFAVYHENYPPALIIPIKPLKQTFLYFCLLPPLLSLLFPYSYHIGAPWKILMANRGFGVMATALAKACNGDLGASQIIGGPWPPWLRKIEADLGPLNSASRLPGERQSRGRSSLLEMNGDTLWTQQRSNGVRSERQKECPPCRAHHDSTLQLIATSNKLACQKYIIL